MATAQSAVSQKMRYPTTQGLEESYEADDEHLGDNHARQEPQSRAEKSTAPHRPAALEHNG